MFVARDICLAASLVPLLLFLGLSGVASWLLPMIWVLAVFMLPLRLVIGMAVFPILISPTIDNLAIAPLAIVGYLTASKLKKRKFLACFVANLFPYTGILMLVIWPIALLRFLAMTRLSIAVVAATILVIPLALGLASAFSFPVALFQVKLLKIIEGRLARSGKFHS